MLFFDPFDTYQFLILSHNSIIPTRSMNNAINGKIDNNHCSYTAHDENPSVQGQSMWPLNGLNFVMQRTVVFSREYLRLNIADRERWVAQLQEAPGKIRLQFALFQTKPNRVGRK